MQSELQIGPARRIVIASTKGGVGKSLISQHLACYAAALNWQPTLVDCDSQRCGADWHESRIASATQITLVKADDPMLGGARNYTGLISPLSQCAIIDTPAGMRAHHLTAYVRNADTLLVPFQPSIVDLRATRIFLSELNRLQEFRRAQLRVGLILNRVKKRTLAFRTVLQEAEQIGLPVIGVIRDSQSYNLASALGKSLFDIRAKRLLELQSEWNSIVDWLRWPMLPGQDPSPPENLV